MTPPERPPTERPAGAKQSRTRIRRADPQREIVSSTVTKEVRPVMRTASDQERRDLIALTAYYLAESRGFEPGHEEEDWIAAEARVRQLYEPPV